MREHDACNPYGCVSRGLVRVGGIVQSYGQKSTHTRLKAHKTAVAEKQKTLQEARVGKGPAQKGQKGQKAQEGWRRVLLMV